MAPGVYLASAIGVLFLHLLFNAWIVFGAALTRSRPYLARAHILSLIYGAIMESAPWPCPLTPMENGCLARAGRVPYEGPFLLHYLRAVVYPDLPQQMLDWCAVAVCLFNLAHYARRYSRTHHQAL